jgi:hypothetical protein
MYVVYWQIQITSCMLHFTQYIQIQFCNKQRWMRKMILKYSQRTI